MSENIKAIKKIISISDNKIDFFLEFCEKNITNKILDRCNIDTIPERLNLLIQEFLIEQYELNKAGIGEGKIEASSASDNGQTVNFKITGGTSSMSQNVDEFLDRNIKTLISYRRMRR